MENPLNNLLTNIISHFIKSPNFETIDNYGNVSTLIKIHNEKLCQMGDVSFPCKTVTWQKYFPQTNCIPNEEAFRLFSDDKEKMKSEKLKLLEAAKEWLFPVQDINIRQERCHLYLQRNSVVRYLIPEVMQNSNYGHLKKAANRKVYLEKVHLNLKQENLAYYRSYLLYKVLQKLLVYSSWQEIENKSLITNENPCMKLNVLSVASKSETKIYDTTDITIKCGLVTDPSTNGKICQISTPEYISMRSNDLTLMALHKYGIRVKQDARFRAQMERLGTAAVTVDLLEVKHTSPVKIIRNNQGSTKGAAFVLYNSARLESMLRTFQERIELEEYEPLPKIDNIQWELLKEEEEWQLAYVYIAGFPDLIHRCLEQLDRGLCSTHLIIRFLQGLVAIFSVYYHRVKILTEKRDHLMPYVYARIYLIKAVREILNKTLALLDIEPVEFM